MRPTIVGCFSSSSDRPKYARSNLCPKKAGLEINDNRMIESKNEQLRVAVYARVSTEEQREGQTIDSQVSELERFADTHGWVIVSSYKDAGWSGSVMARPDLDRLRDDARSGRFQAVLINDVDRLARDVAHLGIIKRDWKGRTCASSFAN